jgi:hypothetical protein
MIHVLEDIISTLVRRTWHGVWRDDTKLLGFSTVFHDTGISYMVIWFEDRHIWVCSLSFLVSSRYHAFQAARRFLTGDKTVTTVHKCTLHR